MKHFFIPVCILIFVTSSTYAADINPDAVYKITNTAKNKVLSVKNSSLENLAEAVAWTETGVNAQRWKITKDESGDHYYITNVYTGKALHANGSRVNQYNNDASDACKWDLAPVENENNCFYIVQLILRQGEKVYAEIPDDEDGSSIRVSAKTDENAEQLIWKLEAEDEFPNYFSQTMRDNIMNDWKNYYYKKASTGYVIAPGGWWGDAEMFEIILDAYETTGNLVYQEMFDQLYRNFTSRNGSDWLYNEYNDDIAWMVIACARASLLFGSATYKNRAQVNFNKMYERAMLPSGMLRWRESSSTANGTNSCINGPAEVAACYLAMATGDESYYEKAKNLYALQRQYLYVPSTGQVYDSFTWNNGEPSNYNHWASTYNQGTFLGAAIMLYNHYGNAQYKSDAQKIVDYVKQNMCNARGIINVCGSGDDLSGFKGILMRYLRRFVVDLAMPDYVDWMQANVVHAYNNRNSKGIIWTAWWEKTSENFVFNNYNYREKPFGSSTAVSAAFNTPIDKNLIVKNAFSEIEAENFNYLKGIAVESTGLSIACVANIKDGYWTAYNNVNFGNRTTKNIRFRVAAVSEGQIEIRTGAPDGTLLGTATIPVSGSFDEWTTVDCEIEPVSGVKNIYLVFKGGDNLLKLNSFVFDDATLNVSVKKIDENGIKTYPNPVTGKYLYVNFSQNGRVEIYNINGKQIFSSIFQSNFPAIDVSCCEKGIYIIKIKSGETEFAGQFIKQ
ncbi:MAG: carbohydrate-binding protein [Dysgonamonadaceae bacterium]|nr:carbohydrate-binding protein [Dysgonamonadaceae bacterium]